MIFHIREKWSINEDWDTSSVSWPLYAQTGFTGKVEQQFCAEKAVQHSSSTSIQVENTISFLRPGAIVEATELVETW